MRKTVIGVTGGIGSGKTAVTDYFAEKGITIVDADLASRVVVESGRPALSAIAERHGSDVLEADGSLNRRQLRDIIFKNDNERVWLEQLLHPLIRDQILLELQEAHSDYTVLVSPLLVETDQHVMVDRILVVDVPVEMQIERTMTRDGMTEEQTLAIIKKQASREQRQDKADDLVNNSGSLEQLHQQLEALHQKYLKLVK
ncbi:dephospho-CoA kinase [Endozoicomonas sp. OPT23]|nr:dephospho-CoA kinase [Endozoicomonas sp. OPT23]MRI33704.1 dephospho-CoA kinase [Endozoicomonas sp. OPT23]